MRAIRVSEPFGLDHIEVVEVPDPTPGPGEALVRMRAVSLNYRDLMMVQAGYRGGPMPPSITPFSDGCGVVEAIGEGVTRVEVGDRVATMFFQGWISGPATLERTAATTLGHPIPGVGRELAVYSQEGLSKAPDYLTDEQVSTLPCAALTAWRAMFVDARLNPGDTVVLQGTGGVSIFGLQFGHAAGMRTLITSSSDEKLARAKALGADHLVNYRTAPEWAKTVKAATAGRGADLIMEVGGGGTINQSMRAVRLGGHVAIIGMVAGAGEGFNPPVLIGNNAARMQGVWVGSRDMFEDMCRALELHRIQPVVDRTYPFTEVRAALEAMKAGEHFGKIVLKF
jgi:NADPH:quinone reductase-like Zn-dependent oxidoreductase